MLVPRRVFFVWSWTPRENITILQRQFRFVAKNSRSKSCSVFCRIAEQINYFQVIFVVLSNQKRENGVLSEVVSLLGLNSMLFFVGRKPTTFSHQPGGKPHRFHPFLAWNDHPSALGRPERRFCWEDPFSWVGPWKMNGWFTWKSLTPWKINMEHNHRGLEDHVPF